MKIKKPDMTRNKGFEEKKSQVSNMYAPIAMYLEH